MPDIGPSLAKLRRDWQDAGEVEVPTGMIARRVLHGMVTRLSVGEKLTVERTGERLIRVVRTPQDKEPTI